MSILLGNEIQEAYYQRDIYISNYKPENLGPNSYDVTLDNKLITYTPTTIKHNKVCEFTNNVVLDVAGETPKHSELIIPKEGLILKPGILYLGSTVEAAGSNKYVPMYEGRSSMARLGIQSHISAGFGDIGFQSNWTLEITVVHPTRIYPNMRIGQVFFHKINQQALKELKQQNMSYNGKYKNQTQAQMSKSFLDF